MKTPIGVQDHIETRMDRGHLLADPTRLHGWLEIVLIDEDGLLKAKCVVENLITEVGDEYYGERAAGIASPPDQVTGMRLGTDATAPTKTGAASFIGAYITGSNQAIEAGFPTSALEGSARRISWQSIWAAGDATDPAIAEVVLTNEDPLTDVQGTAANTIARALVSPTVDKGAGDTLTITWHHDLLGAQVADLTRVIARPLASSTLVDSTDGAAERTISDPVGSTDSIDQATDTLTGVYSDTYSDTYAA